MSDDAQAKKPGFFDKIKHMLNIGGLKMTLEVSNTQLDVNGGTLSGKLHLKSERAVEITNLTVKLVEKVSTEQGGKTRTKWHTLGETTVMNPSVNTSPDFSLTYNIVKTGSDMLQEKGGALGALGKLGSMAAKERKEFYLEADGDVKGSVGAKAKQTMNL